jgi:hypothetical protein
VAFVRLRCTPRINDRRVVAEDRRAFGKLRSVDSLRRMQTRWRLDEAIPCQDSLEIDNSTLDPGESARRIATHFSLPLRIRDE